MSAKIHIKPSLDQRLRSAAHKGHDVTSSDLLAHFCPEHFVRKSVKFICKQLRRTNARALVLGVSGGVDSAVVARLCQLATERYERKHGEHIKLICVFLPSLTTSADSAKDARALARAFSLELQECSIAGYQESFSRLFPTATPLEMGNLCARVRMATLYHYSSLHGGIVVGTSNRSELLLGYGTIFGDLACAINPIAALFKTQIFALARFLHIPESIIAKPPSADLVPNQSDERDLGFSYAQIDLLLLTLCTRAADTKARIPESSSIESTTTDLLLPRGILRKELYGEFDPALVDMVLSRIARNAFKLQMPKIFLPKARKHSAHNSAKNPKKRAKGS